MARLCPGLAFGELCPCTGECHGGGSRTGLFPDSPPAEPMTATSVSLLLSPPTVTMTLCLKVEGGSTELGHQFCWCKIKINPCSNLTTTTWANRAPIGRRPGRRHGRQGRLCHLGTPGSRPRPPEGSVSVQDTSPCS